MALTRFIALLRGVNVGGRRAVSMADLRAFAADLGLSDPRTLLQSGNLVFGADAAPAELEARLETQAEARLVLATHFIVRTAAEWDGIIAANPFADAASDDPGHLLVVAMKAPPDPARIESLKAAIVGREQLRAHRRELYIVYPDGIGTSKLTSALIERKLGLRGTGRNWNTVLKLADLAGD